MTYNPPPSIPEPPPPPSFPPPQPVVQTGQKDRTELFGWIGIVTAICCCGLLGLIFGYLSMKEAKARGKSPVLGYIAMGLGVLGLIWNIIGSSIYFSRGFR